MPRYRKPSIPDFRRLRRTLTEEANAVLERETERFAESERKDFVRAIKEQDFASFRRYPLKRAYFKRKKQLGLDERIMIATGWYTDHIRVWRHRGYHYGPRVRWWHVGFHPRVQARDHKGRIVPILLNRLALVHEFGSADQNIPPRRHWGAWLRGMRRRAKPVRERIRSEIMRRMRIRMRRFAA